MRASTTSALLALAGAVAANTVPFKYPLANGFPKFTSKEQVAVVEEAAGGPFPISAEPTSISDEATMIQQIVAFEEFAEVAFYTMLMENITNRAPGFENVPDYDNVLKAVTAIQSQEQLHALAGDEGLRTGGRPVIAPCEYIYDVASFDEAIACADDFTSLVLGGIGPLQKQLAADGGLGATALLPVYTTIAGQEGQQDGFFRYMRGKTPSANAFLTTSTPQFLFNHIHQEYVVPGSCPQKMNTTHFEVLKPLSTPQPQNSTMTYSTTQAGVSSAKNYVVYLSGNMLPLAVPITEVSVAPTYGNHSVTTTFKASFPFDNGFSHGLTIAALTNSAGPFKTAAEVTPAVLAGPALLQVL